MASLTDNACPALNGTDITTSYGYNLMGSFLSSTLWGASSLQVFIYFMNNAELDSAVVKSLIAALWVVDTAAAILVIKSNWPVLILEYGKLAGLAEIQPELMHRAWLESIVIVSVQMYFIYRIHIFAKTTFKRWWKLNLLFTGTITLLASWRIIGNTVYLAYGYGKPLAVLSSKLEVGLAMSYQATVVTVDIAVASGMVYLIQHQSQGSLFSGQVQTYGRAPNRGDGQQWLVNRHLRIARSHPGQKLLAIVPFVG
ncbi:hypothetical protein D9615_000794 [Tricholomella constricta]|uniref:Uncharacterized protein n=1 Tax=Tricholomella constricta TaxID=117010 RepID=A0A8H5HRY4_9AGAR|nr:hypothetical protein D9615_000794 [Tricholomella constricta]